MLILPEATDPTTLYRALVSVVTPRPIAWVSTVDARGRVNLAPFSFFNVMSSDPPIVVFAPALRGDGSSKHTLANVRATGEFVVNVAVESVAEALNATSADLPEGVSEAEAAGLELLPSAKVKPPRVAASPVHLECVLRQLIPLGEKPGAGTLVLGEVVAIHVDPSVMDERGRVDPRRLKTIGRLGGNSYSRSTDVFDLERPKA